MNKTIFYGGIMGALSINNKLLVANNGVVLSPNILDMFYPVGTIYQTDNDSFDPNITWGGVWQRVSDRFLVGSGNNYFTGDTGGEAAHTLTIDEIPSHRHSGVPSKTFMTTQFREGSDTDLATGARGYTSYEGNGEAHNNLPPYLAVNIWKRTA